MLSVNSKITFDKESFRRQLKDHPYRMPSVYSIWICNFPVPFCDRCHEEFALYRVSDVGKSAPLPIYKKKRYIVIGLTKYIPKNSRSPENEWLKLFKTMPQAKLRRTEDLRPAIKRLRSTFGQKAFQRTSLRWRLPSSKTTAYNEG
jgi:hypothetical protein